MCAMNSTYMYVVQTSDNGVISSVACCHSLKLAGLSDRNKIVLRPGYEGNARCNLHKQNM